MGGSRRRLRRSRPTVTIRRARRKPLTKIAPPQELTAGRPGLEAKLGAKPDWDITETRTRNYAARNNFLADPNAGFGRNRKRDLLQEQAQQWEQEEGMEDAEGREAEGDDDLRRITHQRLEAPPAPPPKLTAHQRQVVGRLVAAHGEDLEAMVKDTKLNQMLLPASKLKRLVESWQRHDDRERCSFRTPHKRLW